jgi:hypothetical protein
LDRIHDKGGPFRRADIRRYVNHTEINPRPNKTKMSEILNIAKLKKAIPIKTILPKKVIG